MATGAATAAGAAAALKSIWSPEELQEYLYKRSPLLGMMEKVDDFEGNDIDVVVQYGGQQGVGPTIAAAIANKSGNIFKKFVVTRGFAYATGTIDAVLIDASRSNKGAVVRALKREQDALMANLERYIAAMMFGNGGGALAQVGTVGTGSNTGTAFYNSVAPTLSTSQIQLKTQDQVIWFDVDQIIQVSTTDGTSGAVRSGTLQVAAVNPKNAVITFTTTNTAGISAIAADDYVFLNGCFGFTSANPILTGIDGWLPTSDPTSTTFYGVDRSVSPVTLAGMRFDGGGGPYEQTLQEAGAFLFQQGAEPDVGVMNPLDLSRMIQSVGNKTVYQPASRKSSDMPTVGYKGITVMTPNGSIDLFPDRACKKGRAYLLQMNTWSLHTLGKFPRYLDRDGLTLLRETTTDQYSWRVGAYGNPTCELPGKNMVVTFLSDIRESR